MEFLWLFQALIDNMALAHVPVPGTQTLPLVSGPKWEGGVYPVAWAPFPFLLDSLKHGRFSSLSVSLVAVLDVSFEFLGGFNQNMSFWDFSAHPHQGVAGSPVLLLRYS